VDPKPDTSSEHPAPPSEPSEEDIRKLVEQLRSSQVEQVIANAFSTLLSAAEVKLGRRDARLLIDLCTTMLEYAGEYLSDELGKQVENMLGQLRLGQVSAESQMAAKGDTAPNDLARIPKPRVPGKRTEAPAGAGAAESPASRLWVPGR
jgi:hypothetical protein